LDTGILKSLLEQLVKLMDSFPPLAPHLDSHYTEMIQPARKIVALINENHGFGKFPVSEKEKISAYANDGSPQLQFFL